LFSATLSPDNVIPPRRLATLFNQALDRQQETTPYFVLPPTSTSLLHDQTGERADFPLENTQKLTAHTDEVWNIVWSWDGKMLASAGRDKKAFVWKIGVRPSARSSGCACDDDIN
jgi:WD40 repeat protein